MQKPYNIQDISTLLKLNRFRNREALLHYITQENLEISMSDILDRIRSGAGKVAKEADKAVDIKRIELQISSFNKQLEEEYQKLGQIVYENNLLSSEESDASSILVKIDDLKQQIIDKENEIAAIKEQVDVPAKATSASGKKFCGECGAQNDANSKFCSNCGAKMP